MMIAEDYVTTNKANAHSRTGNAELVLFSLFLIFLIFFLNL